VRLRRHNALNGIDPTKLFWGERLEAAVGYGATAGSLGEAGVVWPSDRRNPSDGPAVRGDELYRFSALLLS